eukprot:GHVU01158814.1.p2 GENE.GHVU01158814.1~~GHVU01158814.1.p2  ORF type:complete len:104 (-),score=4.34 GHVU01158814.1:688-999(-)
MGFVLETKNYCSGGVIVEFQLEGGMSDAIWPLVCGRRVGVNRKNSATIKCGVPGGSRRLGEGRIEVIRWRARNAGKLEATRADHESRRIRGQKLVVAYAVVML